MPDLDVSGMLDQATTKLGRVISKRRRGGSTSTGGISPAVSLSNISQNAPAQFSADQPGQSEKDGKCASPTPSLRKRGGSVRRLVNTLKGSASSSSVHSMGARLSVTDFSSPESHCRTASDSTVSDSLTPGLGERRAHSLSSAGSANAAPGARTNAGSSGDVFVSNSELQNAMAALDKLDDVYQDLQGPGGEVDMLAAGAGSTAVRGRQRSAHSPANFPDPATLSQYDIYNIPKSASMGPISVPTPSIPPNFYPTSPSGSSSKRNSFAGESSSSLIGGNAMGVPLKLNRSCSVSMNSLCGPESAVETAPNSMTLASRDVPAPATPTLGMKPVPKPRHPSTRRKRADAPGSPRPVPAPRPSPAPSPKLSVHLTLSEPSVADQSQCPPSPELTPSGIAPSASVPAIPSAAISPARNGPPPISKPDLDFKPPTPAAASRSQKKHAQGAPPPVHRSSSMQEPPPPIKKPDLDHFPSSNISRHCNPGQEPPLPHPPVSSMPSVQARPPLPPVPTPDEANDFYASATEVAPPLPPVSSDNRRSRTSLPGQPRADTQPPLPARSAAGPPVPVPRINVRHSLTCGSNQELASMLSPNSPSISIQLTEEQAKHSKYRPPMPMTPPPALSAEETAITGIPYTLDEFFDYPPTPTVEIQPQVHMSNVPEDQEWQPPVPPRSAEAATATQGPNMPAPLPRSISLRRKKGGQQMRSLSVTPPAVDAVYCEGV